MALASKNKGNKETEEKTKAAVDKKAAATDKKAAATDKKAAATKTPDKSESKDVATRENAALPAVGKLMGLVLDDMSNVIPVEAVTFGTLPMIKASQGALKCEKVSLGKQIEFSIVSYHNQFAITPNENNADTSYCKFSYDGEELNDGSGTTVKEHIAYLKEEGFPKAAAKRYIEVVGILEDADEESDEIGNMVMLSLSPMSVKQFDRYKLQTTVKVKQGKVEEDSVGNVLITAKPQSFGSNDFTIMTFSNRE